MQLAVESSETDKTTHLCIPLKLTTNGKGHGEVHQGITKIPTEIKLCLSGMADRPTLWPKSIGWHRLPSPEMAMEDLCVF